MHTHTLIDSARDGADGAAHDTTRYATTLCMIDRHGQATDNATTQSPAAQHAQLSHAPEVFGVRNLRARRRPSSDDASARLDTLLVLGGVEKKHCLTDLCPEIAITEYGFL